MASEHDDPIPNFLRSIAEKDPQKLGGVRTTPEIAEHFGITKDSARYRLEKLTKYKEVECVGAIKSEKGQPVGWKIAA
jgi:hypothetical protein